VNSLSIMHEPVAVNDDQISISSMSTEIVECPLLPAHPQIMDVANDSCHDHRPSNQFGNQSTKQRRGAATTALAKSTADIRKAINAFVTEFLPANGFENTFVMRTNHYCTLIEMQNYQTKQMLLERLEMTDTHDGHEELILRQMNVLTKRNLDTNFLKHINVYSCPHHQQYEHNNSSSQSYQLYRGSSLFRTAERAMTPLIDLHFKRLLISCELPNLQKSIKFPLVKMLLESVLCGRSNESIEQNLGTLIDVKTCQDCSCRGRNDDNHNDININTIEKPVLINVREGKPINQFGRRSILFKTNQIGFALLYKYFSATLPYYDQTTKLRMDLTVWLNCRPYLCKKCFKIGPHSNCCGQDIEVANRDHHSRRVCSRCGSANHVAKVLQEHLQALQKLPKRRP